MYLHEALDYRARIQTDAEFAVHEGEALSYGEAQAR